jgi:hypothetical protein
MTPQDYENKKATADLSHEGRGKREPNMKKESW